jgi:hypothetical protein
MNELAQALLLPFVAGFIVQRFLELVDLITSKWITDPITRRRVLAWASLGLGFVLACTLHLEIFHDLKLPQGVNLPEWLDWIFTGIFISAGTEGFNSLLKFAYYRKESSKADAAARMSQVTPQQVRAVNP